jgi:hypothetical protein
LRWAADESLHLAMDVRSSHKVEVGAMERFTVRCEYGGRWEEQVELTDDDLLSLPQNELDDRIFALAVQLRALRGEPWPNDTVYYVNGRQYTPD